MFSGASWFDQCNIKPGFQSPYIFPHYERYAIGKGCLSRETTSSGSQVHVINLRRGPPRTLEDKDNRVLLNIQPYIRTGKSIELNKVLLCSLQWCVHVCCVVGVITVVIVVMNMLASTNSGLFYRSFNFLDLFLCACLACKK